MTTCSICYEKFTEEYENMIKNSNGYVVRSDLDIGISHECETKNCECIICHKCEMQIIGQMNDKDTFKCPMCRQYQWKYHFDVMVLGMDLLIDWRDKKKRELQQQIIFLRERKQRIEEELQETLAKLEVYN
jgi:hypothetical protein